MEQNHPHFGLGTEALALLRARAEALARDNTGPGGRSDLANAANAQRGTYLIFGFMEERYGVPIGAVNEVIRLASAIPVPGVPSHITGLTRLRGRTLPLVNLRAFWKGGIDGSADSDLAVVADLEGYPVGFLCNRIEGLRDVSAEEIEPTPSTLAEAVRACLLGLTGRNIMLVSPAALVARPGFVVR
jgi:chemotaxis signal transduction protein